MTTLIIPDIHEKLNKLEFILSHYKYDKVIFLGDYFDKFGVENTENTVNWLYENYDNPNYTFLLGNHDIHYFFGIEKCCGFTHGKNITIKKKFNSWIQVKHFKLFAFVDKFICSHAGLHLEHFPNGFEKSELKRIEYNAIDLAKHGVVHPIMKAGIDRGGSAAIGGVLWLDWKNFKPIPGVHQIVGHSQDQIVREKHGENSHNYCIDTSLRDVAIIHSDGGLVIDRVPYE